MRKWCLIVEKIKKILNKVDGFFNRLDVKNVGYKVNKWIFRSFFMLLIVAVAFVGYVDGWRSMVGDAWYECPETALSDCYNPNYNVFCYEDYCRDEWIPAGTIITGNKPCWLARHFESFMFGGLIFCLLLNHLLYNRSWRFKLS